MLQEGLLFANRYTLIRQLGRGGFAEVWLAEDNLTHVQVAVKVYAPGTGLDENGIKMFTEEFSVVFDMNHTNLLRPTHYDCYERMPYLIMPYIKNGSAFKYLAEGRNIPEDECWKMLHDVASGLAYLHEKTPPLIHQDIKPDNIMIDDEGRYLITDFGISARIRSTIRGGQAQEQSGGTLAYMGPERFSATPKPIMASDVWSLGAMMFELMTGTPPFGNHGGVLQKNGAEIPIIEEDYSQELKDIVYSCLSKETWDRPSAMKIEEMTYNKLHGIAIPAATIVPGADTAQPTEVTEANSQPQEEQPAITEEPKETPQLVAEPIAPKPAYEKPTKGKKGKGKPGKEQPRQEAPVPPQVKPQPQPMPQQPQVKPQNTPQQQQKGKKSDKRMLYGGLAVAALVIGSIIAMCSGGDDSKDVDPTPVVVTEPTVNYDSLAQVCIRQALDFAEQADTFMTNHPDDMFDAQYPKVEDIYFRALMKYEEALANQDKLSGAVASEVLKGKSDIKAKLYAIYKELDEGSQFVPQWKERADGIAPSINDMIEYETTNTNGDINEETN